MGGEGTALGVIVANSKVPRPLRSALFESALAVAGPETLTVPRPLPQSYFEVQVLAMGSKASQSGAKEGGLSQASRTRSGSGSGTSVVNVFGV